MIKTQCTQSYHPSACLDCTHSRSLSRQGLRGCAQPHHTQSTPEQNVPRPWCLAHDERLRAFSLVHVRSSHHPWLTLTSFHSHPRHTVCAQNFITLGYIGNITTMATVEIRLECSYVCYWDKKFRLQRCCAYAALKIWPGTEMISRWLEYSTASATYSALINQTSQMHGSICYRTILIL